MTDKEKLEKIKVLADTMYNATFNITTDASRLKKAMYDYHQFVIQELHKEEPVSIWHNMDEIPIKGEVIVVQTKDTFYGLSVQKGGSTYKNRNKDRYIKWAYASDLLSLSNVQRDVKDLKCPISKDLEEAAHLYVDTTIECFDSEGNPCCYSAFIAGAQWQKQQTIDKACEWLKENKDHPLIGCEDVCLSGYLTDEFIEYFKKAMLE